MVSKMFSTKKQNRETFLGKKSCKELDVKKNKLKKLKTIELKKKMNKTAEALAKYKDDTMFHEFLDVHLKDKKKKIWNNEFSEHGKDSDSNDEEQDTEMDSEEESENINIQSGSNKNEEMPKKDTISDKQFMEFLKHKEKIPNAVEKTSKNCKFFTVKLKGLGYNHGKSDIKKFFSPLKCDSIRVPRKVKGIAYVGFKTEKKLKQALNKDRTFLDGKRIFVFKFEGKQESDLKVHKSHNQTDTKMASDETNENLKSIETTGKLFARNITYTATESKIKELFEKHGPLSYFHFPIDESTGKPKGFCFITFENTSHAVNAYSKLNEFKLEGRNLYLYPGKSQDDKKEDNLQKDQKQKSNVEALNHWSVLFLGLKPVTAAIAETHKVSVKQISEGVDGKSLADLVTAGETVFVKEAQEFLEHNGVNTHVFNEQSNLTSENIILVKNIPSDTSCGEIHELFSRYGSLGRVVLPQFGITAIVEFLNSSEAKTAFNKLSYSKFKSAALYLDWSPADTFNCSYEQVEKCANPAKKVKSKKVNTETGIKQEEVHEKAELNDDECEPEDNTTLFVKNLNFLTTAKKLKKHFAKCGQLHSVTIATKVSDENPGETLSKGYGFVRYKYKVDAMKALDELQDTELDGKTLELMLSNNQTKNEVKITKKTNTGTLKSGLKIMVRNVAFEAQESELRKIFKPFGKLTVVLPRKSIGDKTHKGFGFVEYQSKSDAMNAFKALEANTTLHNRRLLLEWAHGNEVQTKKKKNKNNQNK